MKKTLIIIGIFAVIIIVGLFSYYNKFVTASENVDGQWAQVESQYQRRFDLIPNLVESVKGVMGQEKEVFGMIADARTKYAGASTVNEKAGAA
ncbi:LemA family protein, partial [Candidatus Falkowbacteria bacterium CG10_big_fil_rev_8_21_14_0_10_37_6]